MSLFQKTSPCKGGRRGAVRVLVALQRAVGRALWATRGRAVTVAPGRGGGAPEARPAPAGLGCHRQGGSASCGLTTQVAKGLSTLVD